MIGIASQLIGLGLVAYMPAEITIERQLPVGKRLTYSVVSSVVSEDRNYQLDTFMPQRSGFEYTFTMDVLEKKPSGFYVVRYRRPKIVDISGETAERDEKRTDVKFDWDMKLTLSPTNEVTDTQDLNPPKPKDKKKEKEKDKDKDGDEVIRVVSAAAAQDGLMGFVGGFVQEIYRLAGFFGGPSSLLDVAPTLPLDPVAVGGTWKKTEGYAPQLLKGEGKKKAANQRLDYTYTYLGPSTSNGKAVERIGAKLNLDSDLNDFLAQMLPEEYPNPVSKIPMKLKTDVVFELEPKTFNTLKVTAKAEGNFEVWTKDFTAQAREEGKVRSEATSTLISITDIPKEPVKKPATAKTTPKSTPKKKGK